MDLTSDDSARVQAAVLLAPVGSDTRPLGQIAHRWGLHINNLDPRKDPSSIDSVSQHGIDRHSSASVHLKKKVLFIFLAACRGISNLLNMEENWRLCPV